LGKFELIICALQRHKRYGIENIGIGAINQYGVPNNVFCNSTSTTEHFISSTARTRLQTQLAIEPKEYGEKMLWRDF